MQIKPVHSRDISAMLPYLESAAAGSFRAREQLPVLIICAMQVV